MAISNLMIMEEIQRLQSLVNGLAASIVEYGERTVALETWRNGHEKSEHEHIWSEVKRAGRQREKQEAQLWDIALKVANLTVLMAVVAKMANLW